MYISDMVEDAVTVVDAGEYNGVDKHSCVVNRQQPSACPQLTKLTEAASGYSLHMHATQMSAQRRFRRRET